MVLLKCWLDSANAPVLDLPLLNEYTDFYSTRQHAQNVGTMFRGVESALPPNWLLYLRETGPMLYEINLEVTLQPEGTERATTTTRTNYNRLYYSAARQLGHHAINGCEMNVGDLLGSGTISGQVKDEFGSLLELSWGGKQPITLDTGEKRSFLEDGDWLTLFGHAGGNGYRIGFGEGTGRVLSAVKEPDWNT